VESAIDLTFRASPADYRHALDAVLADPGVDAAVVIHAPPLVDALDEVAHTITEAAARARTPVVAVRLGGDDGLLTEHGPIPAFAFPETAVSAPRPGGSLRRLAPPTRGHRARAGRRPRGGGAGPGGRGAGRPPSGTLLPIGKAGELLDAYGIRSGLARGVTSLDGALAAAHEVGYPVALKAAGIARLARSEAGGVALDLQDPEDLEGAYTRMCDALGTCHGGGGGAADGAGRAWR
jgi:acyl-CoA synthetase (NDP forming)